MYLSSIQQGIQAGHAAVELMRKYKESVLVDEWAKEHHTFILLNGGGSRQIADLHKLVTSEHNPYPWAEFRDADMDNLQTSICILLPERMFDARSKRVTKGESVSHDFTFWEICLLKTMSKCRLAQ